MRTAVFFLLGLSFLCNPYQTLSQTTVLEPSTGKSFPSEVMIHEEGKDVTLQLTGVTVRKKFVFKVYGMAHYMEAPGKANRETVFREILEDGKAKEIVMDFDRDVESEKIREAFRDGFNENASPEALTKIQSLLEQFTGYFTKDVKEQDQFVFRWLSGGAVVAVVQGEQKPVINSVMFAETLWSIWFGEDSIVDRDELVSRLVE